MIAILLLPVAVIAALIAGVGLFGHDWLFGNNTSGGLVALVPIAGHAWWSIHLIRRGQGREGSQIVLAMGLILTLMAFIAGAGTTGGHYPFG